MMPLAAFFVPLILLLAFTHKDVLNQDPYWSCCSGGVFVRLAVLLGGRLTDGRAFFYFQPSPPQMKEEI